MVSRCDVSQSSDRKAALWTLTCDMATLVGIDFTIWIASAHSPARESAATRAMTLAGVDVIDGKPVQWKIREQLKGGEGSQKGIL